MRDALLRLLSTLFEQRRQLLRRNAALSTVLRTIADGTPGDWLDDEGRTLRAWIEDVLRGED